MSVERLATGVSGDLGYSVWLEHSEVRVPGRDAPAPITLRVTHIFRREECAWRLVHRHGDPIVEKTEMTAVLRDP
jgi:ketosteroid isomerase-like protein